MVVFNIYDVINILFFFFFISLVVVRNKIYTTNYCSISIESSQIRSSNLRYFTIDFFHNFWVFFYIILCVTWWYELKFLLLFNFYIFILFYFIFFDLQTGIRLILISSIWVNFNKISIHLSSIHIYIYRTDLDTLQVRIFKGIVKKKNHTYKFISVYLSMCLSTLCPIVLVFSFFSSWFFFFLGKYYNTWIVYYVFFSFGGKILQIFHIFIIITET